METKTKNNRLIDYIQQIKIESPHILVIGDVMLDQYTTGTADRISPEAPVPVLTECETTYQLGGAANVALMCRYLGARVTLIGIVGNDYYGHTLVEMVQRKHIHWYGACSNQRGTTHKHRISGVSSGHQSQQIVRVDTEDTKPLDEYDRGLINAIIELYAPRKDGLIIADYAKGVWDQTTRNKFNSPALSELWKKSVVDPRAINETTAKLYDSCYAIMPNRKEAGNLEADKINQLTKADVVINKLDKEGSVVTSYIGGPSGYKGTQVPPGARIVRDVTGAGDQYAAGVACVTALTGSGPTIWDAAWIGALLADLQCERLGCQPVTTAEVIERLEA
jgi:D-beta-D-heptose 7-phosphate kinase/D-beta-D-heptose 1-phosphate adenosyltransferase